MPMIANANASPMFAHKLSGLELSLTTTVIANATEPK